MSERERNVVELPENFIGVEDAERLESFGAHLIAHGRATRWHWNREHGIDVAFEIFRGGPHEELMFAIRRDRDKDAFYVTDSSGRVVEEGSLDHVMAVVDSAARAAYGDPPA